jgi:hypothetical protein
VSAPPSDPTTAYSPSRSARISGVLRMQERLADSRETFDGLP